MANNTFLDYEGLALYDSLIKEYFKAKTAQMQKNADAITILNGDVDTEGSVKNEINKALEELIKNAPDDLNSFEELAERIQKLEKNSNEDLKEYIDTQDKAYYDSIQSIEGLKVEALFPVTQQSDQSAKDLFASVEDGSAIELVANQTISEDIVINKSCYIDAKGSTFAGQVSIPSDVEVIIENAVFNNPVVII